MNVCGAALVITFLIDTLLMQCIPQHHLAGLLKYLELFVWCILFAILGLQFFLALVSVSASLFGMATNSTFFVQASVIHKMYFLFLPDVTRVPNRSAWILWIGWFCTNWWWCQQVRFGMNICSIFLTFFTILDEVWNTWFHVWPSVVLLQSGFCFVNPFVTCEESSMTAFQNIWNLVN